MELRVLDWLQFNRPDAYQACREAYRHVGREIRRIEDPAEEILEEEMACG